VYLLYKSCTKNNDKTEKKYLYLHRKHRITISYIKTAPNKFYFVQMARITVSISSWVNVRYCLFSLNINVSLPK